MGREREVWGGKESRGSSQMELKGGGGESIRAYRTTGQKLTHRYLLEGLKSSGGSPGG
jgi:hypothetical protein